MFTLDDDLKAEYPFQSHYLDISGHQLHYVDEGPRTDTAIVMVHGNPTWSFYYRNLIKAFSSTYRVVVPDHIGCGMSDKPQDYNYTLINHIENLQRLLDSLELKSVILLVHDWGGAIGTGYAVRNVDRIKGMAIFNSSAFFIGKAIPFRIRICRIPGFGELAVRGCNAFAAAATKMASTQPGGLPKLIARGMTLPYDSWANRIATLKFVHDIPVTARDASYEVVADMQSKLHHLTHIPKQIYWGAKDFCFTTDYFHEWLKYFPESERQLFAQAGHYVVEDALTDIITGLKPFFAKLSHAENIS